MGEFSDVFRKGHGPPPMAAEKMYINPGKEDQMEIYGYKRSLPKTIVVSTFYFLTVGILRLVFYWKPDWMLRSTYSRCSLDEAVKVLLLDQYMQWFVENIHITSADGERIKHETPTARYATGKIDFTIPAEPKRRNKPERDRDTSAPLLNTEDKIYKFFNNKKLMYVWNCDEHNFERLWGLEENLSCSYFHTTRPLTLEDQTRRRVIYGFNAIVVKVTPIIILIFTQILNPFYVFQLFSCILWYFDEYYYYASAIVIMSVISLTVQIIETRSTQRALKKTISGLDIVTRMTEEGEFEDIMSDTLVPGDILEVPKNGCIMQCDAVLITGNVIVNESMLTGESVPVTKTPIPNPQFLSRDHEILFNLKDHSRHVLFCGTQVIQTRYYGNQKVKAVVIRTAFSTAKGELVRSIMFPKPVDFKFSQDAYKFIGCLGLIALLGMGYTLWLMISRGDDAPHIIVRTLDLITIVVPPALPAAMTIGIVFSQKRLKKLRVFCISPRSINVCGAVNTFCFDKTGTLTEDGLDMQGVVPADKGHFREEVVGVTDVKETSPLMAAMAACHSLTIIDGSVQGDPLDLKMFQSTGWELEEPGEDTTKYDVFMPTIVRPSRPDVISSAQSFEGHETMPFEIGIVRQFTFSSRLQRMSVVARTVGSQHFDLYVKGAPEMIASLSKPNTVPADFHDVLMRYTQQGLRVIALAWRPLKKMSYVKIQKAQREQMEHELTFLGLLVMENRLKPQTTPVIKQLKSAKIRTVMVTGDNMLTALSVARDCHMIERKEKVILVTVTPPGAAEPALPAIQFNYAEDAKQRVVEVTSRSTKHSVSLTIDTEDTMHFAITGKSWGLVRRHYPDIIPKLVVKGTVFARFSPDQKQQLVEALQEVGYYVGMCGDGANDCGALKTAHAGISLSEAEASVASPFTSQDQHIGCVPTTIREGRAALVTSFGIFKFMATYSMTQFASVCLLYWIGANLTDFTFLYIDLALLTTLSITFVFTHAYPELVPNPPQVSLVHPRPIASIIFQVAIHLAIQLFMWFFTQGQPWFEPYVPNEDEDYACHEVTVVFLVSQFQYITMAICYSKSAPYRKTIFSNYGFMLNIALCVIVSGYLTMYPAEPLAEFFELYMPPSIPFRAVIIGLAVVNFFICYLLEVFIIDSEHVRDSCDNQCKRRSLTEYDLIEEEITATPEWPPVSKSIQSIADLMKLENGPADPNVAKLGMDLSALYDESDAESLPRSRTTSETAATTCDVIPQRIPPAEQPESPTRSPHSPLLGPGAAACAVPYAPLGADTSPLVLHEADMAGGEPHPFITKPPHETTAL